MVLYSRQHGTINRRWRAMKIKPVLEWGMPGAVMIAVAALLAGTLLVVALVTVGPAIEEVLLTNQEAFRSSGLP